MAEVLVKHRSRGDSFCMAYDECKFRIPWGSVPAMHRSFAEHQADEIEKALAESRGASTSYGPRCTCGFGGNPNMYRHSDQCAVTVARLSCRECQQGQHEQCRDATKCPCARHDHA